MKLTIIYIPVILIIEVFSFFKKTHLTLYKNLFKQNSEITSYLSDNYIEIVHGTFTLFKLYYNGDILTYDYGSDLQNKL